MCNIFGISLNIQKDQKREGEREREGERVVTRAKKVFFDF